MLVCVFQRQIFRVAEMGRFRRACYFQNRVSPAKRIGHGFRGVRVGHPLAVHYQAVFIGAGRQSRFLPPMTDAGGMQSLGFGLPMVEGSREANGFGCWMRELKANRHELGAGAMSVVMVMVVFHGWLIIGMFDIRFLKNVQFRFAIMRPKILLGYGVLPCQND